MIRIKPRRCGYGGEKGYTCQRLPQLQDWMFNEEIPFIAQMKAEFDKLPLRVKGMVYTEETIDMGWSEFGPHPEVPELTCRSNTDPASDTTDVSVWGSTGIPVEVGNATAYPVYGGTSGWLDLFNSGYEITGSTQYFYHNSSGTAAATSDVYIKVTGVDHEYHDIYLVGNIPTFKNGEQEMEMGPGLLEPMLDTDFAPVGIDTIPAWEAGLDADIFTNIVLNAWKGVIDDRIQNIYARLNTLPAYDTDQKLRDLTAAENKDSECDNFQITLESGSPVRDPDDVDAGKYHAATLPNADNTSTPITVGSKWNSRTVTAVWQDAENIWWWWTVEDDPNQYTISGGDIAYGDNTISVVGLSGLYAPFYAYLMPSFDVTITHTDVVAADVPTVVDGGTARMITDGDVLPSGGTVTGFMSSGSGAATRYAWETVGDNTAEIRTKTGSQLSEEGTADPEPGGIGIGGVRIIQSAAESDPLILYKIYHEDCIAGIEKPEAAADAATAGWLRLSPVFPYEEELMNVEIPSGTEGVDPTVIGATAGIVQPVHNIQIHGSTEYRTQSPVDVPTVEAVYNFIHNYDDFADGEFEQASALATGSTMYTDSSSVAIYTKEVSGYTGSLAVPGTAIVATDIKTILVEGRTVTASGCVPTAQAVVDYIGELTFDGVVSTVGIIGYTANVPETLWPIPGSTVDPAAGYVQNVRNIYVAGTHSVSSYAVPTVDAVYNFIHNIAVEGMPFSSARATIGGTTATVSGATAYGCTPGTFDVVSNIDASTVSGVVTSANDVVPTADAVAKYVQSHTPIIPSIPDSQSGILVVNGDDAENWDEDYIPVPGIVRVSREINVSVSNRSISLQAVPSLSAVADYVAGYTASIGGFTVTGADAEAWTRSGDPVVEREAIPGIVGVVDTLVAAATVSNRTLSISTVPTVAAVKDYVDEHIPGAPVSGQLDFNGNFVNGTTVTAGIVKVSTNVKGGAAGSDARTAVPTADAVYTFVSGYQAVIGLLYAPEDDTEEWQEGHEGSPGLITVVGNMDVAPDVGNRTISTYSVPTADAVYDFVHGLVIGATAGTMEEGTVEGSPTGEACTGAVSGIVLVARNVWLLDDYSDRTVSNHAVPTVEAVYNFIRGYTDNYAGGASYPVADILAIPGRLGVSADGTRDSWLTGTDYAPTQGVVQTAGNIVAGSTAGASTAAVPTVRAIYNFIHSKSTFTPGRALATGSTITAPVQGTTVATYAAGGTPGTCYVCEDMEGLYGSTVTLSPTYGTHSLASVVPTVEAVKKYVAAHGGTSGGAYTGYFAADENGIADGIAIFGSTVINVTGSTTALTGTQSAWAVIWKNDNGSWGGTVGTTYSTGIKKVSYLVAHRINNEIKQVQYGGISIEGRWD